MRPSRRETQYEPKMNPVLPSVKVRGLGFPYCGGT